MNADAPICHSTDLRQALGQMITVLNDERQALAGLDMDAIMGCAVDKAALCNRLEAVATDAIDEECRGMVDAARRLNEANRRVRNLIAANVAARLDALTGSPALYRARAGQARAQHARTARLR
jgi:hypothetical protein